MNVRRSGDTVRSFGHASAQEPVKDQLDKGARARGAGPRDVSSRDVARAAGLSQSTVSRVLNGHTTVSPVLRQRVQSAMDRLGYVPNAAARSLITGQTRIIGLVISNITNPFFAEFIESATARAATHGYSVVLSIVPVEDRGAPEVLGSQIETLVGHRVDGIILTATQSDDDRVLASVLAVLEDACPIVAVRPSALHSMDTISVDYRAGTALAVQHLIDHGCQRIAFVGGRRDSAATSEYYAGYKAALRRSRIRVDPRVVSTGEFTYQSAYARATALLLNGPGIDGVFTAADAMALGCLDALADGGFHVPENIRVIGFDDIPAASLRSVGLTTIRGAAGGVGEGAIDLLLDRMLGLDQRAAVSVKIPTELIVRKSCGC